MTEQTPEETQAPEPAVALEDLPGDHTSERLLADGGTAGQEAPGAPPELTDEQGDPNALDAGDFVETDEVEGERTANDPVDLSDVEEGEVVDLDDDDDDDDPVVDDAAAG